MSESTIRGHIENFSPKPDEDYYGILVDTGDTESKWLNGDNDVPDNLSKGDKVKIRAESNGFIDIKDIEVVGSGSNSDSSGEGEGNSQQGNTTVDSGRGTNPSSISKSLTKDKRIMLQVAFKEAVETVRSNGGSESQGEHLERIGELTNGYFNLLEAQAKDKSQSSGGGE